MTRHSSERLRLARQRVFDIAGDVEIDYTPERMKQAVAELESAIRADNFYIPEHLDLPASFRDFVVALAYREARPNGCSHDALDRMGRAVFERLAGEVGKVSAVQQAQSTAITKLAEQLLAETRREP